MGYEVHIVRNENWWEDETGGGIALDEWLTVVSDDDSLRLDDFAEARTPTGEVIRYENEGLAVWLDYTRHDEPDNMVWFDFRNGRICVKNPDKEVLSKMHQIALQLDASVYGDEGGEFDGAGRVIDRTDDGDSPESKRPWWKFW